MQFMDALMHRHRLFTARVPENWAHVEVRCPACGRVFVAKASPREDPDECRRAARTRLIRSCPGHAAVFIV